MTKLKTLLSLANKINQSINQFRMNITKPWPPEKFVKLGENAEESSTWLSGDSVAEYIEKEQDGYLLKDKISQKRKYPEQQTKVPLQDSEELFIRNWAKTQCESSREFTQCPRARVQAQSEAEIPLFNETLKVERILELRDTEPL